MKAHIATNQNAGVPLVLGWNLTAGDRGILDGMADAFGMKVIPVSPSDGGKTVAELLGERPVRPSSPLHIDPNAYPSAILLANFKDRDIDTLLDLLKTAKAQIPLKAVATRTNRQWTFSDLLAHLTEERAAFARAQAPHAE